MTKTIDNKLYIKIEWIQYINNKNVCIRMSLCSSLWLRVCARASSLTNEPPASLLPVTLSSHPSWQKGLQLPSLNIRYSDPCCDFLSPAGRDLSSVLTETRHFFSSATEESSNSHEAATKLGDKNTQPDSHPSQLDTMKTLLAKHLSGSNVREASSQVHIIFRAYWFQKVREA